MWAATEQRAALCRAVRRFFDARGFTEVETASAVATPGEEVHLRAFCTTREAPDGREHTLWLRTSPEFAMKRLLADGAGPIFQLARVWRNGEAGPLHHHEFTMLEWYVPGLDLDGLIDQTEALLRAVLPAVVTRDGHRIAIDGPFERMAVAEAFRRYAGGLEVLDDPGDADALARRAGTVRRGTPGGWQEDWEDLFFRLMLERVEPQLGRTRPTVLTHWPVALAALARPDPTDGRVALRFELYAGGLELANAFDELTDAVEQRRRFDADRARRRALGGTRAQSWPRDDGLLDVLPRLPPCAGAALGLDRLLMLRLGVDDIASVAAPG